MKRGYSGAIITASSTGVTKRSDKHRGLIQQAELCERLYPVTPKIVAKHVTENMEAYAMELLYEPVYPPIGDYTPWAVTTVKQMRGLLASRVWSNHVVDPDLTWMVSLKHWLNQRFPDICTSLGLVEMAELYFSGEQEYRTIHGDPTFANVLYRANGDLVICDPIPAHGKIPSHYTVDLGKMLQSAMGWESELYGWRYNTVAVTRAVLRTYSMPVQARAWLWAAIHCLRIIPYAVERRVEDWALSKAIYAAAQAGTFACYMRST